MEMTTTEPAYAKDFVSIIIPCYNEQVQIASTITTVRDYLESKNFLYEIIIVDDGSTDRTRENYQPFLNSAVKDVRLPTNKGKGLAVKYGVNAARGDYIIFTDADLSTPIDEVEKALTFAHQGYDVVIGSRVLAESNLKVRQPWYRETMGKIFNKMVHLLFHINMNDTQCGFKCFKAEAARHLFERQTIDGFCFDVELLYLARLASFKTIEIPITWSNREESRVSLLKGGTEMFIDLLKLRLKYIKYFIGDFWR